MVAVLSFMSWDGLGSPEFVGTDNWKRILGDPVMIRSIWLTLLLTALGVVLQTPLSIVIGVWAAGHQRNRAVLSAIYFIPLLLSATAVSVLWRALLDPNFGIPARMTWLFGDGNLFGEQASAIGVLAFVSTWQYTPFHTLIYQGAARAIPPVLYQAAEIDGAGRFRQFFHITLPQLRNSIVTSMILMIVGGLTTFETVLILTQGGPGTDTTISAYYMYQKAFKGFDFGAGSAIALCLVIAATVVSLIVVRVSGYDKMRSDMEGVMRRRPNYLAGAGSIVWLVVVGLPLYVMLAATLRTREDYAGKGPVSFPDHFTLDNYTGAFDSGFGRYFLNTIIVTVCVVGVVLLLVPPLAYAIVRSRSRIASQIFRLFLLGLAIPAQAVIVPMFYLISEAGLYDNLLGVILPTAAFCLPMSALILSGAMRDISPELFEAMTMDGASPRRMFFQLVVPLSRGGLSTIVVFSALQAWNGFLFPLVLTQSEETKVITLGLYNFQTAHGIDIPGLLGAVTLSMVPVLLVYLFARRALVQGLMGMGGK